MSSHIAIEKKGWAFWASLYSPKLLRTIRLADFLIPVALVSVGVYAYAIGRASLLGVLTIMAFSLIIGFLRIPSLIGETLAERNYYSELDKEMLLVLTLFQAVASSGAGLDEVFSSVSKLENLRYFKNECYKYRLLRGLGRTWDESLEELENEAPHTSKYRAFLRGLLNTARTSLRLPNYIDYFLEDYLMMIENSWKAFWDRAGTLVESVMLMTLCFATIYVAVSLIEPEAISIFSVIFSLLLIITGFIGSYLLRLMRPLPNIIPLRKKKFLAMIFLPWVLSILLFKVLSWSRADILLLISGLVLTIGGLLQKLDVARAKTLEERNLQLIKSIEELTKSGYSIKNAISKLESKNINNFLTQPTVTTFLTNLILFVLDCMKSYGWVTQNFITTTVSTIRRLVSIEKSFQIASTGLVYMGVLLPAILAFLTIKAFEYLAVPLANVSTILTVYAAMCIATNMIVSEAADGLFLFTLKPGLSLIFLYLATLLVRVA